MSKRHHPKPANPAPPAPADDEEHPEPGVAGSDAIATLEKHKGLVLAVTLAIALAVCLLLVFKELGRQKNAEAGAAFTAAAAERSIEKLDAVVADFSGTVAAGNALLTKAEIQADGGNTEDAKATFTAFVNDFPDHPLHDQGLYALGNLHQSAGDNAKAAEFYDRLLGESPDSEVGPLVTIRKGDIALAEADALLAEGKSGEAEERKKEAERLYNESITKREFRMSPFYDLANARLELLVVGRPPVVPPPPKPEPKPEPKPKPETGAAAPTPGAGDKPKAPAKPAAPKTQTPSAPAKPVSTEPAPKPAAAPTTPPSADKPKKPAAPTPSPEPAPKPAPSSPPSPPASGVPKTN
ncbi:MAG: tetratricopeptide repeat protein [Verrucomicrobiae bacterium]|nr:tetratricopeptide repeat protein [Verrucomicrobiae bacterium]MCP5540799.1 tetratricopeptide repeat protein [Akkermansiaceae bacterium]MCP5551297.1 tetratricopeptide repeat protein [Akkermansiaceae bacterium]